MWVEFETAGSNVASSWNNTPKNILLWHSLTIAHHFCHDKTRFKFTALFIRERPLFYLSTSDVKSPAGAKAHHPVIAVARAPPYRRTAAAAAAPQVMFRSSRHDSGRRRQQDWAAHQAMAAVRRLLLYARRGNMTCGRGLVGSVRLWMLMCT